MRGVAGDRQAFHGQRRAFGRHQEFQALRAPRRRTQRQPGPGAGHAQLAGLQRLDVAGVVHYRGFLAERQQLLADTAHLAQAAAGQAAPLVGEQHGEGFLRGVLQADAAGGQAGALLRVEQQAPAGAQRAAQRGLGLAAIHRQAEHPPHVGHRVAVGRLQAGKGSPQLRVDRVQLAEPAGVQLAEALLADQRGKLEVRRHDHVVALAATQGGVQLVGAGVHVVVDADAGVALEVREYLWGDVVGPVGDAQDFLGLDGTGGQG
ncbi:hypothetical protein D3C80_1044700 [compost metagenome]